MRTPLLAVALLAALPHAPHAQSGPAPVGHEARVSRGWFALDETAIPNETALQEQLEEAIELREREHFDRVLDAREPGELIEHATLTETDLERRPTADIETLFVVGDELFGHAFRPADGWGAGAAPSLRRVHLGRAGGPDAFGCFACHSKGGPDGAGAQTQNAFFNGDGDHTGKADERSPPHLLGLGPIALLAREMSSELQAQAAGAAERAKSEGRPLRQPLATKGVSFGAVTAHPDGTFDRGEIEGVDSDLRIRPFGWKGHQATIRDMSEESFHLHQGVLSKRIQLAVRDGSIERAPYGPGKWFDVDEDGVSLELDSGMLTTMVGYLAQLEAPVLRPPRDPWLLDLFAAGRARFDSLGCADCHVPTLELESSEFPVWKSVDPERPALVIDVAKDGEKPKIEPKYARADTPYLVHLFSDLKRHDMGPELASPSAQGGIPAPVFLTRPLWGLAETAPYLHDGRAPTVHEAILLHGGEAAEAREAYRALDENGRASVRVFLMSLSRQPKLFVP